MIFPSIAGSARNADHIVVQVFSKNTMGKDDDSGMERSSKKRRLGLVSRTLDKKIDMQK